MAIENPRSHRHLTDSEVEKRLLSDLGFRWAGQVGSTCPVMVEFEIDGFPGTFRARGSHCWFIIARRGTADPLDSEGDHLLNIRSYYGKAGTAGYIPLERAFELVEAGIALFRQTRNLSDVSWMKWAEGPEHKEV